MDDLETLYREKARSVYNFFLAKGFSREDSLELVQETFLEAHRSLHRFEGHAQLGTWLVAIAKNLWRNRVRYETQQKRTGHEIALDGIEAHRREALEKAWCREVREPAADDRLIEDERRSLVRRAIDDLPPRQRQCLRLRIEQGLQYKEIAIALGISEGTAKTNVRDARNRLAERISS